MLLTIARAPRGVTPPEGTPPVAWLPWMDPVYYLTGTGTKNVATAGMFDNAVGATFSLQGTPPAGVSINTATGVVSISTTTGIPWTTLTIRAANAAGYADVTLNIWVFTPDKTIAANAAWSTVTPSAGDIVVVRGGTYTDTQDVTGWSGTEGTPTRVVAYPGETVHFQNIEYESIDPDSGHDIELRGFTFTTSRSSDNFALWSANSARITVAQCDFSGFNMGAITIGQGVRATAGPWTIEYCRVHDCVQQNAHEAMLGGGWARAVHIDYSDGTVVRRNRVYENWGEGIGTVGNRSCTITENIVWDNYSVNVYLDSQQNADVHENILWATNPTFARSDTGLVASSVQAANESGDDARSQPTTGLSVTDNHVLVGNKLPYYDGSYGYGGGAGKSVFTPNTTFATVDDRWKGAA